MAGMVLTLHRDYRQTALLAQLFQRQVILRSLETEVGFGFKSLEFDVPLSEDRLEYWIDESSPYWMCHLELVWRGKLIFEGQLAEIVEADGGVQCTAVGYWNALWDDWIGLLRNWTNLGTLSYGQTAQGLCWHVVKNLMPRLQVGEIPGPASPFDQNEYDEPQKIGDFLRDVLDKTVENKFTIYPWFYAVWDERKFYTFELSPANPAWLIRRRVGIKPQRSLTLGNGYATTAFTDYETGNNRTYTDEHTDLIEVRRLGYQRVHWRREADLVNEKTAETLAEKEMQIRSTPAQLGGFEITGPMEDIGKMQRPGFLVRAGEAVRVEDYRLPGYLQQNLAIYHTKYNFGESDAQATLDLTLNSAPPRLALSKGGVIYAT